MSQQIRKITKEGIRKKKEEIINLINNMPIEFRRKIHEVFPEKNTYQIITDDNR